jgi:hypothetical protein
MANRNSSTRTSVASKWDTTTADYFTLRLEGARCIAMTLSQNVEDYTTDEGRASDEAITLSIQHVKNEILQLEKTSYEIEFSPKGDTGDLSLKLMWARALMEVLDDMFGFNGWKVTMADRILGAYLQSVVRLLVEADDAVMEIQEAHFPTKR